MKTYKQWIAQYQVEQNYDMESFIKTRILVAHTGINHNGSSFSLESFENAKATIMNKPLLARVVEVGENQYDFNGHDIDWHWDEEKQEWNYRYLEQPIGVIPETNDYEIVEFDNREYVAVTGYVWRGYSNLAEKIIEQRGEVEVSMEIDFADEDVHYDEERGVYNINNFRYKGVTFLGAHVQPGMEKAHAVAVFSKSDEEIITEYTRMIEALKVELEAKKKSENPEEPELNVFEREFKALFAVDNIEDFNRESFQIMPVTEYAELTSKIETQTAKIQELEGENAVLAEYKKQRESEDLKAKRDEVIAEYCELMPKADVLSIADKHEDLRELEFELAMALKEKIKNETVKAGSVSSKNDNMFKTKKEPKKQKELAL